MSLIINENGKLEIDVSALLDSLSDEGKLELIENLSCADAVIKHVTDQIFDGYTENLYSGGECHGNMPYTALEHARRRVAMEHSDIVKDEHQKLVKAKEGIKGLSVGIQSVADTYLVDGGRAKRQLEAVAHLLRNVV